MVFVCFDFRNRFYRLTGSCISRLLDMITVVEVELLFLNNKKNTYLMKMAFK